MDINKEFEKLIEEFEKESRAYKNRQDDDEKKKKKKGGITPMSQKKFDGELVGMVVKKLKLMN